MKVLDSPRDYDRNWYPAYIENVVDDLEFRYMRLCGYDIKISQNRFHPVKRYIGLLGSFLLNGFLDLLEDYLTRPDNPLSKKQFTAWELLLNRARARKQ